MEVVLLIPIGWFFFWTFVWEAIWWHKDFGTILTLGINNGNFLYFLVFLFALSAFEFLKTCQESNPGAVVEVDVVTETNDDINRYNEVRERLYPGWYNHQIVAELDGKVVGRVSLEAPYAPYSELGNPWVHPDYRGRAIDACLVESGIEAASMHECLVVLGKSTLADDASAYRVFSTVGCKPRISEAPSEKKRQTWLFRFSEKTAVSEFLASHPHAETSISPSKVDFHGRRLYQMSWRDPQTTDKIDLFIEGQSIQAPNGTMPRVSGLSYNACGLELEALITEQDRIIRQGRPAEFTLSIWNRSVTPVQILLSAFIPNGTVLTPTPQRLSPIQINSANEKTIQFQLTWTRRCNLPCFTTFPTVVVTCFFGIKNHKYPLFVSAGFEKEATKVC